MSHKGRSQTTFWHHFGTIGHRGNHGQHGGSRPHQLGQHHSVLSVAWRSFLLLPGAILWNVLGEFLYEVYASYAYDNYVHSLCTIVTIYSTYMNMIEWYWMCISIAFMIIFFVIQGIETAGWWAKILPNQRMILVRMWRKPLDKRSCNLEQPWLVSSDPGIRTWAPWASTDAFDARFNGRVLFRRIGTATLKKDMWGMSLMSWATLMTLRKPKIWESTMSRCRLQDKSGFLSLVELNSGLQTLSLSHSFSDAEAGTTYPLVN